MADLVEVVALAADHGGDAVAGLQRVVAVDAQQRRRAVVADKAVGVSIAGRGQGIGARKSQALDIGRQDVTDV